MQSNPLHAASPQRSAVVTASAGVGKTYLLVTRLVRLLLAGARPDAILAITFTRKAAGEMQTRLGERLFALAQLEGDTLDAALTALGVEPTPLLRRTAQNLYEVLLRHPSGVRATTFHAFCQEILRRFPLEADVPPGFELLDRTGATLDMAWDALYAEATRAPESELGQALETLFEHTGSAESTRTALTTFTRHRSDWWAFVHEQDDPVAYASEKLLEDLAVDLYCDPISAAFSDLFMASLEEFADLLGKQVSATTATQADAISATLLSDAPPTERFTHIWNVFFTSEDEPRSRKHTKTLEKALGPAGAEHFLALNSHIVEHLLEANEQRKSHAAYTMGCAWYFAGHQLLSHYQRIKQEQRALDFSDLEWKAYLLLSQGENAQWVQFKLDQRIDHMLIDEFQDTNPTQWRLLEPLLCELASSDRENRSVFLVGDVKQSIYGFRRADPRLLPQAAQWLEQNLDARQFPMDTSRRSASAIMELVNRTFGEGPLAERIAAFQPHQTHREPLWGHVELLPLVDAKPVKEVDASNPLRNPLLTPRAERTDARHLLEGQQLAEKITELMQTPILIGPTSNARPLQYGDILVLMRARTHAADYEQALREARIPYIGANRGTLLGTQEIQDMVALLTTLNTAHDNLNFVAALRSPLFDISNDELLLLAKTAEKGTWTESLDTIATMIDCPVNLKRAHQLLSEWRQWIGRIPIHDLLDRIYDEGNVIARFYSSFPSHLRQRARTNLIRFLELALEIDSGRYPSVDRFLTRLSQMLEHADEAPDEVNPGDANDAVRLMTIHGAKGLEAPVVFLMDTTRGSKSNSTYDALVDWPSDADRPSHFRIIVKKEDRDRQTQALLAAQKPRQDGEDANLLYVAVTRAQQMLFISGCAPTKEEELGWYGYIKAQWPTDRLTLNSGDLPTAVTSPARRQETAWEIDSQLSTRLGPRPAPTVQVAMDDEWQGEHARQRGIAIHRFIELFSEQPAWEEKAARMLVASELPLTATDSLLHACALEARAAINAPSAKHIFDPSQFLHAYNEVPILFEAAKEVRQGVIDRLVIYKDKVLIVDYKTHQTATVANVATLATPYVDQMQRYVNGVRRLYPNHTVQAELLFTRGAHLCQLVDKGTRQLQFTAI